MQCIGGVGHGGGGTAVSGCLGEEREEGWGHGYGEEAPGDIPSIDI